MPQPLTQGWIRFLTEDIPLRQGSWLLNSQPCLLVLHNGVAQFTLPHNRHAALGLEDFRDASLVTDFTLCLANGVCFQLLITQGGSQPLNLRKRLEQFLLTVRPGVFYSTADPHWAKATEQAA